CDKNKRRDSSFNLAISTTQNEEMEPIAWGTEREKTFRTLKVALLSAPGLGFPDYSKPFKLYCDEAKGVAKGVLVQTLGPHERLVAYFSSTLDSVTKGTPFCIRAIAAAAEMVEKTRTIILNMPLVFVMLWGFYGRKGVF
uniref:Reverse transcriptase/retrotransposon-derived protein RNase H-like domain-containing protein n=1 Tax=Buteo japonicus TaxID=224669 RepID=A0A8C0ANL0_9AVES